MKDTFELPGHLADEICRYSLKWHLDSMQEECDKFEADAHNACTPADYQRNLEMIPVFKKILEYYGNS